MPAIIASLCSAANLVSSFGGFLKPAASFEYLMVAAGLKGLSLRSPELTMSSAVAVGLTLPR